MPGKKQVGVCLSPVLIEQFEVSNSIVVVIDVLRATTSMIAGLHTGARSFIPVVGIEECREYKDKGCLIAAERNGEQIEGFDMGNSPYSFLEPEVIGRNIAMSTTNGTQALNEAVRLGAKKVVVGSFANFNKLITWLKEENENVILFCSAWKGKPNLEDTIFAGAMVRRLRGHFALYEDTALIAETLYRAANRRKRYYIRNSSHFNRLMHILQIQKDVKYSLRRDTHPVIPILCEGILVDLESDLYLGMISGSKYLSGKNNGGNGKQKKSRESRTEKVN